jgi:pimeloyl-ACP methyl ester carboxylesterase
LARRLPDLHLVIYDRRGYQGSRAQGAAPGLKEHLDDLVALLDQVSPDRPVMIFGHSFGGVVAIAAALGSPERIGQVLAFEPPLAWFAVPTPPTRGLRSDGNSDRETEAFFKRVVSVGAWERLSPSSRADRLADGPAVLSDLSIIRLETPFTLEELKKLEVQLTIGVGSATAMPHHAQSARLVVDAVPRGRLTEIEGAGHGAHLSHPDAIARMIQLAIEPPSEDLSCVS